MADPSAPAPSPKWDAIKAILLSDGFQKSLLVLVTFATGIATTLITQKVTAPVTRLPMTAADKPSIVTPHELAAAKAEIKKDIAEGFRRLQATSDEIKAAVATLHSDWSATRAPSKPVGRKKAATIQ